MLKVLIIDDDKITRELLKKVLLKQTQEQFVVIEAEDGRQGVEYALNYQPDLIICDIMMPHVDGYETCRQIESQSDVHIPFIFLTAKDAREDFRKGMSLGADDFITKPFQSTDLLQAICTRMRKHKKIKAFYHHEIHKREEELCYLTTQDILTGLPNQFSLQGTFNNVVDNFHVQRPPGDTSMLGIFSIAIDRYQKIVDDLGYEATQWLTKELAQRIKKVLGDRGILTRLNGDDFCAVLYPQADRRKIAQIAQELLDSFAEPFLFKGDTQMFVSLSIGISLYPQETFSLEELLQEAHRAMLKAIAQGGNNYFFYSLALNIQKVNSTFLEADLRKAILNNELEVFYQPKVELSTGRIVGAEALVRWFHPSRGLVSPNQFIPLAEETGLVIPIGEFVLNTVCKQLQLWQNMGLFTQDFRVSVNLSPKEFTQVDIHHRLTKILIYYQIQPQNIELELTESTLVSHTDIAVRRLKALRTLGIRISLDDFGTGYSSLSYLQQFAFDVVKLDRSFVRNIHANAVNSVITESIIEMTHRLGLTVVAEGVETKEELDFLSRFNCDQIQGFIFSRPIRAEEFENSPFIAQNFEEEYVA